MRVVFEDAPMRCHLDVGERAPKAKHPPCAVERGHGVHRGCARVETPFRRGRLSWRRAPADREAHRATVLGGVAPDDSSASWNTRRVTSSGWAARPLQRSRRRPPLPHSLQEAGSSHRHDEVARQEARLPSAALGRDGHHQSLLVTKILGETRDLVLEAELEAVRGRCRHRLPQLSLRHVRPLPGETGPRPTHDDVNRRRR